MPKRALGRLALIGLVIARQELSPAAKPRLALCKQLGPALELDVVALAAFAVTHQAMRPHPIEEFSLLNLETVDMTKVNVPGCVPGGHYSFATMSDELIFTAGHLPVRPDGSHSADATFEAQVAQVFDNLFATLAAAGASPADVLKVTVYLVGIDRWASFNALFAKVFCDHRPARTVVPVADLHYRYLIEVDAIAVRVRR